MLPHCCKDPKSSGMNSRPTQDPTSMKTDHEKDARKNALHGDNAGLTPDLMAPWDPYFLEPPAQSDLDLDSHTDLVIEWMNKKEALLRTYGDTAIMYPDITPKEVNNNFYTIIDVLLPILEKDSPRRFLRFFEKYGGWIVWRSRIIPEALNCLITENAVKCAKVVLEGKAPELDGHRANPNWMSQYGHFPLHQAADIFAVDMIKLLLSKGASANVHMAGDTAIAGLLPLHVAVENTCLHKYLEDSLLPNREHPSYSKADVYKLIHLLCLPEMKVFLDACRELAKHTNGVVDEVWTYIKDGKLVQAGVLLLAAQEHIRLGPSCKKNGDSKPDGFAIILSHIANQFCSFDLGMGQNEREHEQPHADIKYLSSALLLVNVISQAGKALHEYIRVHSEVPHMVAIEHVSSILKDFGFCPPEEAMNIGNLCPYKCLHYEQLLGPPNHMNQYGRFPLHEAAETFSVDMIKLLICKGVSANVHMTGNTITAGLLPLHVAVEKTCLHKYLEDNLLPHREHPSYSKADIYKLIHLLSLPEMKVFLDTTRELAKHTNDLVDEVWNYIKDGKLVHAGVLLLAAQDHIRLGSSSKKNGNSKPDGFATIVNRIADHFYTFDLEMGQNKKELDQQHANIKYLSSALLLVHATSQAGKTLHEYIRVHSEAPHVDVLQRVSLILKDFGFCPAEEGFDVGNLFLRYGELPDKQAHMVPTKKDIKIPCLHASGRKIETKKMLARWELGYKKAQFFPYWRSVLLSMSPVKLFPSHAALEALSLSPELLDSDKSRDKNSAPVQNDNLHLYGRIQQQVNHQPRRSLSTAAAMLKLCMSRKAPTMEKEHKKDAMKNDSHEDSVGGADGLTPDLMASWHPYFLKPPAQSNLDSVSYTKVVIKWVKKKKELFRMYGGTSIMYPDITPKSINNNFYITMEVLLPILEKDCPRRFLDFFEKYGGWIVWRSMIIPEALDCLITENAVKCAKVVLEGNAPELQGYRANPNWMTQYGYFPLHQAAETFSVDMIKLLISKGASANVRTAGGEVIEGLLPLHVAVENTCLHKYLEDNLLPNREHPSYSKADIYKLVHLLCLPEMKCFLDATRELAKHTDDLVDEIWYYIRDGKLVQAGVLLFAAQEHIREESSCKKNGNSKPDGFATIVNRITNHFYAIDFKMGHNDNEHEQPHVEITYLSSALLLVNAISQAGKALNAYIRAHREVPHADVLERVSSVLKDFGFCPTEGGIDISNLTPYKCYGDLSDNHNNRSPLHQAAKTFSVDMVRLLIRKGASANVRVANNTVVEGLLPLHVAVENICSHKYLEDNLLSNREHPSYSKADIYKLIHLLCLPEMKILLDTTRELAKHTNGIVDEVWNYIKDGKLLHAGVLLLAAQEHMRLGSSCKKNGNSKPDGFATIVNRVVDHFYTFHLEMGQNEKEHEQPHAQIKYLSSALLLVNVISQAGRTLHGYIQVHSEVHMKMSLKAFHPF